MRQSKDFYHFAVDTPNVLLLTLAYFQDSSITYRNHVETLRENIIKKFQKLAANYAFKNFRDGRQCTYYKQSEIMILTEPLHKRIANVCIQIS